MLLVDDRLAARVLRGRLLEPHREHATTTTWWWRLGAAAHRQPPRGRLGALGGTAEEERVQFRAMVDRLDASLTVVDLRILMPRATAVAAELGVNLLAAEALAAAEHLGAAIRVATDGALRRPAEALGIDYAVLAPA